MTLEIFYSWILIPVLIFISRICDVTIGTIRIMFISKGFKKIAPILGFIEVIIWLLAISQIMNNLNNIVTYIAYAGGFASGNYIGMLIDEKLAVGKVAMRIITSRDSTELITQLRNNNYGVTLFEGNGSQGKVNLIFTIVKKSHLDKVTDLIQELNPKAFVSIEDVRQVKEGIFPFDNRVSKLFSRMSRGTRKGK